MSPVMYLPSKHDASKLTSFGLARAHRVLQRVELLVDQEVGADLASRSRPRCGRSPRARAGSACRCRTRSDSGPAALADAKYTFRAPASRAMLHDLARRRAAHDRVVDEQHDLVLELDADGIQLLADALLAHRLPGHDERAPDVAVLHEAFAVLDARGGSRARARTGGSSPGSGSRRRCPALPACARIFSASAPPMLSRVS